MNVTAQIVNKLDSLGNRFAKIEFVKKDGSIRELIVQRAAEKYRITGSRPDATETRRRNHPELVNVYSVDAKGFRSVDVRTVLSITADGFKTEYRTRDNVALTMGL